jgi:hypothetical protein
MENTTVDATFSEKGKKSPIINNLVVTKLDTINHIFCGKFDFFIYKMAFSTDKRDSIHIIGFFDCKEGQY